MSNRPRADHPWNRPGQGFFRSAKYKQAMLDKKRKKNREWRLANLSGDKKAPRPWTKGDVDLIMSNDRPSDRMLGIQLNRSVRSIWARRSKENRKVER